MHLQQKRGWSPRSCVPAATCSGYAGHYRNHPTAGSLAALKRDFNITEIEGVSTRIITEALASPIEQSAYVWYARESLNAVGDPQGRRPNKRPRFKAYDAKFTPWLAAAASATARTGLFAFGCGTL